MNKETYHFIGLGGIGMSALARILLQKGHKVQGSDASESHLLTELQGEGAQVQVGHQESQMPSHATVVYSSDIKEQNVEYQAAKKLGHPMLHRSDLLDKLMKDKYPLLVTGTHGKTTTTALLASVLLDAKVDPSFVIGGILRSLKSNGKSGAGPYFVAEADESDGSFLKTSAYGAIVTNLENDHLNYWKSEEKLDQAFAQFFKQVRHPKHLFWCRDDERLSQLQPPGVSYGFSFHADLKIHNYRQVDAGSVFDILWNGREYLGIELSLFGRHNALNAAAVFGLGLSLELPEAALRSGLKNFSGTARRMEFKGEAHRLRVFDDYAHHPTEISVTLQSLRDHVRERRLVAIFQPHRFTRVFEQFKNFASSFDEADVVLLTDIYGSREAPIEGITTEALYQEMKKTLGSKLHYLPRKTLEADAMKFLKPFDVAILLGAGDITQAGSIILEKFASHAPKLTIGVLCGGTSLEHEVSLKSGHAVFSHLDSSIYDTRLFGVSKDGHWIFGPDSVDQLKKNFKGNGEPFTPSVVRELSRCDVCIPVFHGPQGEDGMIQGLLDTMQVPYVGCDYRSAALCMQKSWAKQIAILHNIPTAPFVEMDAATFRRDQRKLIKAIDERKISYPVWIKPVHLGSSLGITRATDPEELLKGAETAFKVDDVLIIEPEIVGREIEFAVLGNEYIRVAMPAQNMQTGFFDYEKKYGANPTEKRVPAPISESELKIGQELAETMYRAAGCKGLARVDFFLDNKGYYWFNEINPFPGFTPASGYPKMWSVTSGLNFSQLCDEFIVLALHKDRRLNQILAKSR